MVCNTANSSDSQCLASPSPAMERWGTARWMTGCLWQQTMASQSLGGYVDHVANRSQPRQRRRLEHPALTIDWSENKAALPVYASIKSINLICRGQRITWRATPSRERKLNKPRQLQTGHHCRAIDPKSTKHEVVGLADGTSGLAP